MSNGDERGDLRTLPLVLLPGTLCDARVWTPMLKAWPLPHPDTIAPTLTGHRTAHAMAAALLASLPPRFALMGFSLGGIVALEMAAQAPDRVAGLALVASNARPDTPTNRMARRAGLASARVDMAAHVRQDLWPRYVAPARLQDQSIADCVLQMAIELGCNTYADQVAIAESRTDSRPRLASMTTPLLVVSGDDDVINPPALQEEIVQLVPNARWLRLEAAGHFVPLEAPEALATTACEWLNGV